jgi:hypothetical protein
MAGGSELDVELRRILSAIRARAPLGGQVEADRLPAELGITDAAFVEGCARLQARGLVTCRLIANPRHSGGSFPDVVQLTPHGLVEAVRQHG